MILGHVDYLTIICFSTFLLISFLRISVDIAILCFFAINGVTIESWL